MSTSYEYLTFLCSKGWKEKIVPLNLPPDEERLYAERLRHELQMIKKANLEDYFLIVWDILRFCDEQNILRGPGRGSVGGCLVAYLTGITKIDSVKYGCLFSRFFNIGRLQTGSLADIDMDIDNRHTDRVIQYIRDKYGHDNVAGISTVVKMFGKMAIKDVARALALGFNGVGTAEDRQETFALAGKITDEFPKVTNIAAMPIDDALKASYDLRVYESKYKEVFDYARRLEGMVRSNSMHPAGLIISNVPLIEHLPMKKALGKDSNDNDVILDVADVDMKVLEERKFLKFDLLKLSTLSVIDDTFKLIEKHRGIKITLDDIDLTDKKVFEYMWSAPNLLGVFQFESPGMRQLIKQVKPRNIEDLAHCNALYRPGPMDSGVLSQYVKRRQGLEHVSYDHRSLEQVLSGTQGLPIFQEQITQIAQVIAGFSEQTADILRAAIGKKNDAKMASLKSQFIDGSKKNGHSEADAEEMFASIEKYGRYAFNKPHSVAYSILAYYTLWLKYYYRAEFTAACINNEKSWDKIALFIFDAKHNGIEVLPLDVSKSQIPFTIVGENKILTGYKAIKGVGDIAPQVIVKNAPYESFIDFLDRTHYTGSKINSAVVSAINACGGFESLGVNREQADRFYKEVIPILKKDFPSKLEKVTAYIAKQDIEDIGLVDEVAKDIVDNGLTEQTEPLFNKRQRNFINKLLLASYPTRAITLAQIPLQDVDDWDMQKKCREEKLYLGYFVSGHPTHQYLSKAKDHVAYVHSMIDGDELDMVIFVDQLDKAKPVNGGKKMYKYTVSDESGSIELTHFAPQGRESVLTVGTVVQITGAVNTFNGKNSIRLKTSKTLSI